MASSDPPMPTDAELSILRVLWQRGPSTVRAVQEHLGAEAGYTTVLKLLQIMLDKGLVTRDESQRAHVYEAAVSEPATQRRLIDDLLDRAFGGSLRALVMRALGRDRVSDDDLNEIRALVDDLEASDDRSDT
ncbi:BlaI/MecI/CopY family transcriptional regulator [Salisaeta longa]|uniref:BlaI/MecI/CopY family transcriptional regulator n=1 Tax=Salisaeta longa TaxID=503170 RepID=UPI0003B67483|nr:BlaI/MecI/CopY family transcriptional regulator [Salisaeta longa]